MISKPGLAPVHAEGPPRRRTAEGAAGRGWPAGGSLVPVEIGPARRWRGLQCGGGCRAVGSAPRRVVAGPWRARVRRSRPAHRVGRVRLLAPAGAADGAHSLVDGPGGTTCWFAGTGRWAFTSVPGDERARRADRGGVRPPRRASRCWIAWSSSFSSTMPQRLSIKPLGDLTPNSSLVPGRKCWDAR